MNIKSIERNGNQATITAEIDKELMESVVQKAYMKARKNIMIPGFRKGKAPRKMIEAMYGAHVFFEDGLEEIFPEVYDAAVTKQDVKAVGRPSLTDMQISEDNVVTIVLTTDVYPEVTLGQYKGIEVEKAEATVADAQIEAELNRMAENVASTETVERAAEMGDTANIDFEGFDNGVAFEGGKGEKFDLELGSGMFIPGFEEQLEGKNVGDECDVNVTFPEEYNEKSLAGKPAVFKCKINEIKENQKPELDDEFAKDVSEFDTIAELKADIEKKMVESKQSSADTAFQERVMDKVIENMEAEIPDAMVETQLDRVAEDFSYRLAMQGMEFESYLKMTGMTMEQFRSVFAPQALRQVKIRLALEKVAELEGMDITEEDLNAEFDKLADNNKMDIAKVKELLAAEDLKADMLCQKANDFVIANAKAVAKAEKAADAE